MDFETFRHHAHAFSDWMADYLTNVEDYPVRSQLAPGDVLRQLPALCPDEGEPMDAIFTDFKDKILPGMTHWQHPNFFAYFSANSSPPSVLAEMLTATLAAQCMLWETSPAASELEARMMEWLQDLLGLPTDYIGSIQDSASSATLCAVIAAIEHATNGRASRDGLAGGPRLALYTSKEGHSSIEKAARIAGLGANNVRKIATLPDHGMDPRALQQAIDADRAEGTLPAGIVGCFGATGLGAIDPIRRIGEIARAEGIHLHIDAAWAGSALILPEVRPLADGLELADSFVFNPHKWLFTNFDCSAFYMRNPTMLAHALSLTPAYLESNNQTATPEYRDWSVALGRRFRALKLWFVLRNYGADRLRTMIRNHIQWIEQLAGIIRETPQFEIVTEPHLALLTFRYTPDDVTDETERDKLNDALLDAINTDGRIYLAKTRIDARTVLRFMVGQTYTQWHHVEAGWEVIQEIAAGLAKR